MIRNVSIYLKNSFLFKKRNISLFWKQDVLLFLFYGLFLFLFKLFNYLQSVIRYYNAIESPGGQSVDTQPMLISLVSLIKLAVGVFIVGVVLIVIVMAIFYWYKIFKIFLDDIYLKKRMGIHFKKISAEFLLFDYLFNLLLGILSIPLSSILARKIISFGTWLLPLEEIITTPVNLSLSIDIVAILLVVTCYQVINCIDLFILSKKELI